MQKHICSVCGYDGLAEDPGPSPRFWGSQEICSCCGWQFGYNNPASVERYRAGWVEAGANWFFPEKRPTYWNIAVQLAYICLTVDEVVNALEAMPA